MKPFGWAFIGYGGIAETVAKALLNSDHRIAAVYGRTLPKAEAFAENYGAKAYDALEEALADQNVAAVYIATPNDTHAYFTEQCILRGKPVLCEKPFSMNAAEAERILKLARKKSVYVAEAMWTWHGPVSLQVRDWIKDGKIGEITGIEATYAFPMLRKKDPHSRLLDPARGGGALMDIGVYPVRYVYELFGLPEAVTCKGETYNGVDVEETVSMRYKGFTAELFVSFRSLKGEKMVIRGTKGSITIPFFHMATKARLKGENRAAAAVKGGMRGLYRREFDDAAAEIRARKQESGLIPHRGTLDVMRLMDDCRRQMGVVFPGDTQY